MVPDTDTLGNHDAAQSLMMKEMCLLVDEKDNVVGTMSKLGCHKGEGERHRAFSVLIFDSEGRLLVQKRASEKITFMWRMRYTMRRGQ